MPTESPDADDFRTALELLHSDVTLSDLGDATRRCSECSALNNVNAWTPHRMHDDGAYECLQCRFRQIKSNQVPADEQATPEDVAEAYQDLGEGPDK